ncbi:acyl carrier protein phosphodiesterase [Jeongeupia sp. HS-3]|uniref:acyl carrier protein phosphodiesterase n=1 Tax=Jeongeupia sp. HS-3 TaxID=1009682 RepID=UPI0018A3F826|nr:ACP phosphodiesterase [Jeongeupia sp. HS-3]BCL74762.1 acyl carrier protein phosphodiesterase [Jeongeupia sp. HS-3]
MNYLAHALLAGPAPADRAGGVAGDFVKGLLPGLLPADLAAGVALHREIDAYADLHPAFAASRARVSTLRRRYGGIMVDLFYDHLLARHWEAFSPDESLQRFTARLYAELAVQAALPAGFVSVLPKMAATDWLASYHEIDNVALALDRMAMYRIRRDNPLAGAADELRAHYAGFEADFLAFMPDALDYARMIRAER